MLSDIFFIPVADQVLLHAPLHGISAVINPAGADLVASALLSESPSPPFMFQEIVNLLKIKHAPPQPRLGNLQTPHFLGLIPTRACNMHCLYCDFPSEPYDKLTKMPLEVCKSAINAYFTHLMDRNITKAAIHFFGGEPFSDPKWMFIAVEFARFRAQHLGLSLHLEATTNGLVDKTCAQWISESFDCIVLSLDGNERIQNHQRPVKNKQSSFSTVFTTAKVISESRCDLVLRSCVTQESLPELQNIVTWMADTFTTQTICLEPMTDSLNSQDNGLHPPQPWEFSKAFILADKYLQSLGIKCMLSTADLSLITVSSCPVGHDALIVSPNGEIDACYLPKSTWVERGKDMHLGVLENESFSILPSDLKRVRKYELNNKTLCKNCFCRYHCAGGCHVNHNTDLNPGDYDDLCIRTRLISIGKLLKQVGQIRLLDQWREDDAALKISAQWQNDRIEAWR